MDSTAFFYPNQGATMKLECEGLEFVATNDVMTACDESRHFLDTHLWGELRERNPNEFSDLVPPNPPCTKLTGTCQEEEGGAKVIGKFFRKFKLLNNQGQARGYGRITRKGGCLEWSNTSNLNNSKMAHCFMSFFRM